MNLTCMECDSSYDPQDTRFLCDCGGLLDVRLDLAGDQVVTREILDARLAQAALPGGSGVWRYRELLPAIPDEHIVSKGEGNTNLYTDPRLSTWTGCDGLHLKHEGENPTGSFKDRGMTVGMSHARWTGAHSVACASTGNTSASVSAYAATAGIQGLTFVPEGKLALGKLVQTMGYGARTVQVRGDFDDAMQLVRQVAGSGGVGLLNSLNPYRLEGQKSIIFEILQQLHWSVPDWIVVPGGNLGNTSSFGKALNELRQVGLIRKMPRLAVIQAAGANPFYQSFRAGFRSFTPVSADTVATAIRIGNPVNYPKAVRALQWTDGVVEQVTDDEILEAKNRVDTAGIGCEPASAASVAGVRKLVSQGTILGSDAVVAILTGHILKDPDSILDHKDRFGITLETVEPDLDAVKRLLEGETMRLRVTVPASAGNAGPGFDSFGLAYGLYNEVVVDTGKPGTFEVEGEGVELLKRGAANLVSLAMKVFSRETDRALPEHGLHLINRIPFGRGLGSSAAAIVGGMAAADALTSANLSRHELLELALKVENHPDNLSAAIHGGAVLTVFHDSVRGPFTCLQIPVPDHWRAVLFVPEQVSATDEARALLPMEIPRRHAIFNHSRVGLLVAAFLKDQPEHLGLAMQDRLHQPYRAKLFPAMGRLMKSAAEAGAWGACLSGAGPSILAATAEDKTADVSSAMQEAASALGIAGRALVLEFPGAGFQVDDSPD